MKKILFAIIALVLLVFGYFMFGNYSTGERAGTVSKLSQKGFIFKTYEGQLNLGGLSGETGSPSSSLWSFSVHSGDKEVIKQLEEALLNGKRVRLLYNEKYVRFFWQGDSKYYVHKVEHVQ
ncbi:MAG: hypothetical protein V4714_08450 [Bacteroidota bacterium]